MIPICLLPAAGASSRMRGGDKLLEPVDGLPCLATMAKRAISAGFEVLVSLSSEDHPRAHVVSYLDVANLCRAKSSRRHVCILAYSGEGCCATRHCDDDPPPRHARN